jgi:hypothetical protein
MDSTLKPKQADDPHDVLEIAPGVVLVAPADPADEEISNLLRAVARQHSDSQTREGPGFSAGPPVPAVDTTFRAAVNNGRVPGGRPSIGGRVIRGLTGFLLAVCIGVAAATWQAYGDAAQQMIANLSPQRVLAALLPLEKPAPPAQPNPPAVEAAGASAAPAQTAPPGLAPTAAALSPEAAPSLQSMARDLASVGQEIEQLKASIAQLKAGQEQMSRDIAKASETKASETKSSEAKASEIKASEIRASEIRASEPNLRPRIAAPISALPPRSAAAPARKPVPSFRPSQAAAPSMLPPAAAPYVPRQPEPLPPPPAPLPLDPELASVPRPPMPVRQ